MKKYLFISCILTALAIFTIAQASYAYNAMTNIGMDTTGPAVEEEVKTGISNTGTDLAQNITDKSKKKGCPVNLWLGLVIDGKKAGDIVTDEDFAKIIPWKIGSRKLDAKSLVAIGVFEDLGNGQYKLLVDLTIKEINKANELSQSAVNRTGLHGEPLGIDRWKLPDLDQDTRNGIGKAISEATNGRVTVNVPQDVEAEGSTVETLAADIINSGKEFTIGGKNLNEYDDVKDAGLDSKQEKILADNMARLGLLANTGVKKIDGTYDLALVSREEKEVVFFDGAKVVASPKDFAAQVRALEPNQTAVIVPGKTDVTAIDRVIIDWNLMDLVKNDKIIYIEHLTHGSKSAFVEFFKSYLVPQPMSSEDILKNKVAIEAVGKKG